ncbi:MAG: hypothetical protein LBT48_06195 [Prevotellaceae bacterium]|jgi:hypothetical protein|nr:hypothetical protein [Prevotellaceae bacterium]
MATFDPTSGYRRLDSWILASIVQFATYRFCEKFFVSIDKKSVILQNQNRYELCIVQ